MDLSTRHEILLRTICDLLPSAEALRIGAMDPHDYTTFVQAYGAARRVPGLTPALRDQLTGTIYALMDGETARVVAARRRATARPSREYRKPEVELLTPPERGLVGS